LLGHVKKMMRMTWMRMREVDS